MLPENTREKVWGSRARQPGYGERGLCLSKVLRMVQVQALQVLQIIRSDLQSQPLELLQMFQPPAGIQA